MQNSRIKRVSLAVCLALMPFVAEAAGLGKLTVLSGLGEPLNAEIELSAGKDELSSLSARIASADVYAEHGVERLSSLGGIRVELGKKSNGSPVLKLSSSQPVNDPFLDMLIQVDWPTGRLMREYTALLDPPGYDNKASSTDAVAPVELAPTARDVSKKNSDKRVSSPVRVAAENESGDKSESPKTYRTQRGDTLRNVARKMQVEDVSLEQMLVGLYRSNRDAFLDQNMNQLKVGKIIHAPQDDALRAVSQQEALEEIRLHASNWNAYRNKLADTAAHATSGASAPATQQSSSGKISATTEDKALPPPPPGPRDVVKLSKTDLSAKSGTGETKGAVTDEKLKSLEEESTAQENAIKEVSDRIAIFEKQIQDMQKLLVVQNQILAELQKKGTAAQPPAAEAPAPLPPAAEKKAAPKPKPAAKHAQPAEPEPSELSAMLGSFADNPLLLAGGGVLVLLGGAWAFLRNRRKKNLDSFEKGILSSSGLKADTVFGETAGASVDTGKTSFMADFAQHSGGDMIDTSDVDPISEADVYMAYGRDAQAEEILKDAIAKEPKRYELHQKLLEIYAKRKDTVAFETLAGEVYAALGASSPIWLAVAELGRHLEPGNPMYAAAAVSSSPVEVPPAAVPAPIPAETESSADNSLDFDLGSLSADEPAVAEPASEELPSLPTNDETVAELKLTEEPAQEDAGLDFDFELPEPPAAGNVQLEASELGITQPEPAEETLPELPELESSTEEIAELELPDEEPAPEAPASSDDFSLEFPEIGASEPEPSKVAEAAADEQVEELKPELAIPPEQRLEEITAASLDDFNFDLPEMATEEPELSKADVPQETAVSANDLQAEIDALDAAFELPIAPSAEIAEPAPQPASDFPKLGQNAKQAFVTATTEDEGEVEEIVLETPTQDATQEKSDLDFDFDLDIGETAAAEDATPTAAPPLPDLDLSSISLDMDASQPEEASVSEEITLSGAESSDVDTKLDLVTAYMDMGDAEGARELLEEVLQEGGPQQRARAQKLLDSLG